MENHLGSVHFATIRGVTSKGINVLLNDIGTEGFVLLAEKDQKKPKFNSGLLTLTTETQTFALDQTVTVTVTAVDVQARRINLALVDKETAARLSVWSTA